MIDEITSVIKHSYFNLYADDIKIYRPISTFSDSLLLQNDLNDVQLWLGENKLSFCPEKCELVSYTRRKNTLNTQYHINNITLNRVSHKKDLGVTFAHNLSFKTHINNVTKSCFRTLGFIKRTFKSVKDPNPYLILFKSLILSKLDYAAVVWTPQAGSHMNKLEDVQATFCRSLYLVYNNEYPYRISYTTLREMLCLESIKHRQSSAVLIFLYKVVNKIIDCNALHESLEFSIPSNRTRNKNLRTFKVKHTSHSQLSPVNRAASLFNTHQDLLSFNIPHSRFLSLLSSLQY